MASEFDEIETVLHEPPGGRRAVRRLPRITWRDSAGEHEVTLERLSLVGSAKGADILIAEPTVSRLHAELDPRRDGLWIRDLGSRNGTHVEEIQVSLARVPDGAKVRLGGAILRVNPSPVESEIELWPDVRFGPLLGASTVMRELFALLARVAVTPSTVLVLGETGTGKEVVARAIHEASPRAAEPLVVVDCAALPEQLLEGELFGHARGAFTGATTARAGAFEAAHRGTVFLDEIGELPLAMQPKLLRVLESRSIRRVGETAHRSVDVRIVSATNRDLRAMVAAGAFREDLYFRLAVLPVSIPPLRDRMEDISLLLDGFLPAATPEMKTELLREALERPWLGNVRELRNFVERAVAFGTQRAAAITERETAAAAGANAGGPASVAANAQAEVTRDSPGDEGEIARVFEKPYRDFRDEMEREYVRRLLVRHDGNVTAAAQAAGVDRTYVHRLLRKHQP